MMRKNSEFSKISKTVLVFGNITMVAFFLTLGIGVSPVFSATVTYTEDMTDFPNPERGIWGPTVIRKYIFIDTYSALPQSFLDELESTFNDIRVSKRKIVPRFRYRNPDAPVPGMLAQIEQLRPVLERHYDVIAVLEMGFIGKWGEWHSSPHVPLTDFVSKKAILFKMLDVLPKERMVALRYNFNKRAIFGTNEPLPITEAFSGSNRARTAAHNDCFITSESDAGTYKRPVDVGGWGLGYEAEKAYLSADNLYVSQEGETCNVGATSYANCERALTDLARMRWDMINENFNESVISQWKSQGCFNEISRRIGYRIVLLEGTFDDNVTDGSFDGVLQLKNVGFGKIYNPRTVELILRNAGSNRDYVLPVNIDPRFWSPGGATHTVAVKRCIPDSVPMGTYSVYLGLRDPAPKLYGIPEYSIRLANKDVWDANKGCNSLNHSVRISSHSRCEMTTVKRHGLPENKSGILSARIMGGNRSVEIRYTATRSSRVCIAVHDLAGRLVKTLRDEFPGSGDHTLIWDRLDRSGRALPAGIYCISCQGAGSQGMIPVVLK